MGASPLKEELALTSLASGEFTHLTDCEQQLDHRGPTMQMEGDKSSSLTAADVQPDGQTRGFNQHNMEGTHAQPSKHIKTCTCKLYTHARAHTHRQQACFTLEHFKARRPAAPSPLPPSIPGLPRPFRPQKGCRRWAVNSSRAACWNEPAGPYGLPVRRSEKGLNAPSCGMRDSERHLSSGSVALCPGTRGERGSRGRPGLVLGCGGGASSVWLIYAVCLSSSSESVTFPRPCRHSCNTQDCISGPYRDLQSVIFSQSSTSLERLGLFFDF